MNFVGFKIQIFPTDEQIQALNQYFGFARYSYNMGIDIYDDYYNSVKNDDNIKFKCLSMFDLSTRFCEKRKLNEYAWMKKYDFSVGKLIMKDVYDAFVRFFRGQNHRPRFKCKKYSDLSFPIRKSRMRIVKGWVKLPSLGMFRMKYTPSQIIGDGDSDRCKRNPHLRLVNYHNPRVSFDGCRYYISFSLLEDIESGIESRTRRRYRTDAEWNLKEYSDVIGIDIGCKRKNWLVASNRKVKELPDFTKEMKRKKKLQNKFNRQYRTNKAKLERTNPDVHDHKYTKNEQKTLYKLNKVEKRMANKRKSAIQEFMKDIIDSKPKAVVVEDIHTTSMYVKGKDIPRLHRQNINRAIYQSAPFKTKEIIVEITSHSGILAIEADDDYPSSQLCSNCGNRMKLGAERIYSCPICGMIEDRDVNAAKNLAIFGKTKLAV